MTRRSLRRLFVILDGRHGIKIRDIEFFEMLEDARIRFQVILTKCDLVYTLDLAKRYQSLKQQLVKYPHALPHPLMVSAYKKTGLAKLKREILFLVGGLQKAREVYKWKRKHLEYESNKGRYIKNRSSVKSISKARGSRNRTREKRSKSKNRSIRKP